MISSYIFMSLFKFLKKRITLDKENNGNIFSNINMY
jgi:hypothetical protein